MSGGEMGLALDILRKAASFALAIMILLTANFIAFNVMPGDPLQILPPTSDGFGMGLRQKIIDEMRLNDPLWVQFADYITDTLTGDFRVSSGVFKGVDIQDVIWGPAGNTLALLACGLLGSLVFGALLERLASGGRGKLRPLLVHGLSATLLFTPAFSLALFILYLNVELGLGFPIWGDGTLYQVDLASVLESAILPVLTVVLSSIGMFVIVLREGIHRSERENVKSHSWLASYASGLVRVKPFVHFHVAWTMCVVIAVDIAFGYSGLGRMMWNAIDYRDFQVLMAISFIVPMMVMAAASAVSGSIHLISGRPFREALNDWGRRHPVPPPLAGTGVAQDFTWRDWASAVSRRFRSLRVGMFAMVMLAILAIVGVLAPLLAQSDPSDYASFEPNQYPDWFNPLPPSFEESPYTGIRHLLGTDVIGRDVFSMWLFALRDAVLVMLALIVGCVAIGLVIGFIATEIVTDDGLLERVADLFLTPVARVAVVTPLLVVMVARTVVLDAPDLGILFALPVFYAWAWLLIVRPIRAEMRAAGQKEGSRRMLPTLVAESLSVAKFGAPLIIASRFSLSAIGLRIGDGIDFGAMLEMSFAYGAFTSGDWHLIIPPLVGMALICVTVFVLLDRAEYAVRSSKLDPPMGPPYLHV